jgi:hydroxymethylbilane synthase
MSMQQVEMVRIGTRGSTLARTQTGWVADRLRSLGVVVEVETISTQGDARVDVPVSRIGGDGVFVRELEQALLDGRVDAAVHSLKDLPTAETPGLSLACVPERATAFDALVAGPGASLAGLRAGAVVGTSSIRRVAQARALRPDLDVRPIRGNVDSRLRRFDAGEFDALILAAAGLERLGLAGRISELLRPPAFWPAVAQGALVVQIRAADRRLHDILGPLDHAPTHAAVLAERSCLAGLAGGCLAPIGAWARLQDDGFVILGACVLEDEGGRVQRIVAEQQAGSRIAEVSSAAFRELGADVAAGLLADGAADMLARMRAQSERE